MSAFWIVTLSHQRVSSSTSLTTNDRLVRWNVLTAPSTTPARTARKFLSDEFNG